MGYPENSVRHVLLPTIQLRGLPVDREPMNQIEEANYIKLDGRVFSITPIANQQMNIEQELKQYYNEKYARHIDLFNSGVVSGLTDDWVGQMRRLQERAQAQSVNIPPALFGKYVICIDGHQIEEVKCIVYSPNVYKMTRSDLADALGVNYESSVDPETRRTVRTYGTGHMVKYGKEEFDLNSVRDDVTLIVKVKQRIFFPAMYSFNSRTNKLHCVNVNTFHSQTSGICTGRSQASDFWASPAFEDLMNQVNCFSLGSRHVKLNNTPNARPFSISDFVKRTYITHIQREGTGQWRTSTL